MWVIYSLNNIDHIRMKTFPRIVIVSCWNERKKAQEINPKESFSEWMSKDLSSAHMDELNVSQSASPSTSAVASNMVSNSNTNEPSCIDIEVDVELSPIQLVESPFPSRASTNFEGFDGGDSVSAQDFDVEDFVFAQGFDGEDPVSAQLSPLLPFYPTENFVLPRISQQQINWSRLIKVLLGVTIIIVGLLATLYFISQRGKANLECKINFIVSKDGKADITTVSEAVEASPSHSPHKVCIFIRMGEYDEIVKIGKEKINLVLMGEGIGKTTISSNASKDGPVTTWPLATLSINGKEFVAQDLTIVNKAKYGVAVVNWAEHSVLFRCKLEGANPLLIKGDKQFYRSCQLYGRNNLVFGDAYAFFQKCEFLSEKSHSYTKEMIVFSGPSSQFLKYKNGFIFHLCAFYVADKFLNSSERTFLGSSLGNHSFFVVMQSYLDASIGGYFLGTSPQDTTYYAIFGNIGHGAIMANIPSFVHLLDDVEAASKFSLRVFLGGGNWIPPEVEYNLDVVA